ncbi:hypothetical protein C8F01DRAFT_1318778 [Mycena amicta]|nr:hypothetical protein C8F01DRAFT_1318778 [Mycena amicta]
MYSARLVVVSVLTSPRFFVYAQQLYGSLLKRACPLLLRYMTSPPASVDYVPDDTYPCIVEYRFDNLPFSLHARPLDDRHVVAFLEFPVRRLTGSSRCSHCREHVYRCSFHAYGVPCRNCRVLGLSASCTFARYETIIALLILQQHVFLDAELASIDRGIRQGWWTADARVSCFESSIGVFYDIAQGVMDVAFINFLTNCSVPVEVFPPFLLPHYRSRLGLKCASGGRLELPQSVSENGVSLDHPTVLDIIRRPNQRVGQLLTDPIKCTTCDDLRYRCEFSQHGTRCSECFLAGTECSFTDDLPFFFVLSHWHEDFLRVGYDLLWSRFLQHAIPESALDSGFETLLDHSYDILQGAIALFRANRDASRVVATGLIPDDSASDTLSGDDSDSAGSDSASGSE